MDSAAQHLAVIVSGSATRFRKVRLNTPNLLPDRYIAGKIGSIGRVRLRLRPAPKRLNDGMAEILRFKTPTIAAFGLQRNDTVFRVVTDPVR